MRLIKQKISSYLSILIIVFGLLSVLVPIAHAYTKLDSRSVYIMSSAGGVSTSHIFSFKFQVPTNIGSLQFQYCDDPIDGIPCNAPAGLDVSGATLDSQSGETGFSILSATPSNIILTRPATTSATGLNTYTFSNITNPSDNGPFFIRISGYPTANASGAYDAFSSVAASIVTGININSEVPQILYFCSAVSIPTNCSDAAGDFIDLDILTNNAPKYATSQFLIGTNALNGYNVRPIGTTMSSGSNVITAIPTPTVSKPGSKQFGINLRANLSPLVGADKFGGSGSVLPNYNVPDKFQYIDGDPVVQGDGPTEIEVYTVSYIVNVPVNQAPGIYNTTVTYLCTANF